MSVRSPRIVRKIRYKSYLDSIADAVVSENSAEPITRRCWALLHEYPLGWGGVARTSRDPPQEPHYGDEVEGSSQV